MPMHTMRVHAHHKKPTAATMFRAKQIQRVPKTKGGVYTVSLGTLYYTLLYTSRAYTLVQENTAYTVGKQGLFLLPPKDKLVVY